MPPPSASIPFIGRAWELARATGALDGLADGHGGVLLLGGAAGIGKSRLADEIAAHAARTNALVLWGRCHEAEGRPPYWLWLQILRAAVRALGGERAAPMLGSDMHPITRLVPELSDHLAASRPTAPEDSDTARFLLFQAMGDFLRQVAMVRPLLVILDDLHWADSPSLLLLDFVTHDVTDQPILVVGTYREVEVRARPEAQTVLARVGRRGVALSLGGFSMEEATAFVQATTGATLSPAVLQRLHHDTDGHPLFLGEIARLYRDAGTTTTAGAAAIPISHNVRAAIENRLAALPETTRELLHAAAIAGREFDLPILEHTTQRPRPDLLRALGPALELEVVGPVAGRPGRYRFAHDLIRRVFYDDLPPAPRMTLHRQIGEYLETRYRDAIDGGVAEIANHFFEAAAAGGEDKAATYAQRAGREALQSLAYEDAVQHFGRALHLRELANGSPRHRCELLLALGEAQCRAGLGTESAATYRQAATIAQRIVAPDLLASAAVGISDILGAWPEYGRSDAELIHLLQEALARLGANDDALRARVLARLAVEQGWVAAPEQIDALSAEAVALARAVGEKHGIAWALLARIECLYGPEHASERLALASEVLSLTAGRGEAAVRAHFWRLGEDLRAGRMADVTVGREGLFRTVRETRQPNLLWVEAAVRSQQALIEGRFAEAEAHLAVILEQPNPPPNARQSASSLTVRLGTELGRYAGLADALRHLVQSYPDVLLWRAGLAIILAESGEVDAARVELEPLVAGLAHQRVDRVWVFAVACLAGACHHCGTAEQATEIYAALLPYDGLNVVTGPGYYLGPVAYHLGLLAMTAGHPADAKRHLTRALREAQRAGARPLVARILLARARLLDRSDPAAAARDRHEGAALATTLGIHVPGAPPASADEHTAPAPPSPSAASLTLDGELWTITYDGRTAHLKALRGLDYLARLLAEPAREFHVLDLAGGADGGDAAPLHQGDVGPLLDPRAKAELQRRVEDLRATIDEAEEYNDHERARGAREELELIGEELARAMGLGGRNRTTGSAAERARASVTKALRAAIRAIEAQDPALADLLSRTVRTGTFCSYEALADVPITWTVRSGA